MIRFVVYVLVNRKERDQYEKNNRNHINNIYLKDRANKDGVCWPSVNRIAADTKMSAATVRRAVKDLRKAKLIETEQRYRYNGENSSLLYTLKNL